MLKEILLFISGGLIGAAIMGWVTTPSYIKGYEDGYKNGKNSLGYLHIPRKNGKTEVLYKYDEDDDKEDET